MKCFRHCIKWYKSRFKNIQVAEKIIIENLTSLNDREKASINRTANCIICFKAQQPANCLGFQSKPTGYIRKTLKHVLQVLESYSFEICKMIVPSNSFKHLPEITSYYKYWWSKVAAKLQLSSVLKIKTWTGGSCWSKSTSKKSEGFRARFGNCN